VSILASAETEYGVRVGKRGRVEPVGSPHDADELIRELFLDQGVEGRLVRRYVTPWEDA